MYDWTTETPTAAGHYWLWAPYLGGPPVIVLVEECRGGAYDGGLVFMSHFGVSCTVQSFSESTNPDRVIWWRCIDTPELPEQ